MPSSKSISGQTQQRLELLGDRTRLEILLVLAQSHRRDPLSPSLSEPDLRRRVGVADPGSFGYHLQQLADTFVDETDSGYRLTPLGTDVVGTVVAGLGQGPTIEPTPLGIDCPGCDRPIQLSHADGRLQIGCADHHLNHPIRPNLLRERSPHDLAATAVLGLLQETESMRRGCCPHCAGHCATTIESDDGDTPITFEASCDCCGNHTTQPLGVLLARQPASIALAEASAVDLTGLELVSWTLRGAVAPVQTPSTDRNVVTIETETGAVTFTLDENARILDVDSSVCRATPN